MSALEVPKNQKNFSYNTTKISTIANKPKIDKNKTNLFLPQIMFTNNKQSNYQLMKINYNSILLTKIIHQLLSNLSVETRIKYRKYFQLIDDKFLSLSNKILTNY